MIIQIDEAVADNAQAHGWLDRLVNSFEDNWHIWEVTGLEDFEESRWVTERGAKGEQVMEMYRHSVSRGGWSTKPHRRRIRITDEPVASDELTPENGARFAHEVLIILVENRNSDGDFVSRVISELDQSLNKWMNQNPRSVHIDSLGGKGEMEAEVKKREGLRPRPRLVVVVDSDRRGPEEHPSTDARRLKNTCDQLEFPCWVLAKREAENYLPRDLLELRENVGTDHWERLEAWDRLSDDQKDYYDMKCGFAEAPGQSEQELFAEVSDGDRAILSQGFGENVDKCWLQHRGRCDSALKKRGREDLEHGLELIRQEV